MAIADEHVAKMSTAARPLYHGLLNLSARPGQLQHKQYKLTVRH